jgi:hypothetical protein
MDAELGSLYISENELIDENRPIIITQSILRPVAITHKQMPRLSNGLS